MTGLEVDLPGRRDGVIYRYPSSDLAAAGATSFLGRHDPFGGVFGCGKNIFFTQARDAEAERWRRRVSAFLTDHDPGCRENQFLVIE